MNRNNAVYYRNGVGGTWNYILGEQLKQVAVGKLGVFGVNSNDGIYYRVGTNDNPESVGSSWQRFENFTKKIISHYF